ncbi:hypothetical protein CNMCM5793_001734 [Aspergillus hiratsukae]|uniref:Transcriptional repressor Tup1 N-terminal domain-containing protein n=1 Tax=Aspergillus hiratsukae TaxID=1194566 RepID=A0A8H6PCA2_9EURO|nr:hypothetical protein CNMCM5793_001734 [Aspergillus hiratsukae]KAF7165245.1 hypothetical protein CNMCM6106_001442 [Aspergillus hiratsukae]
MYNTHRGMVPAPNSRLTELLDQLRQEFENQSRSTGEFEHQLTGQLQEMEMIRQKVYQLEQAQIKMKQEFVPPILILERNRRGKSTKRKSEFCGTSSNRAAFSPSRLILLALRSTLARLRRLRRPWAMAPVICSVES